jgi:ankyrin repeat protein
MPDMPDLSFDDKKSSVSDTVSAPLKDVTVRSDLHKAVCSGSTGAVADALACLGNNGTNTVNQADSGGFYPLHSAASLKNSKPAGSHGVTEITRLLVRAGAVVSKPDLKGNTALHWAARIGNDDTAQKLIMEGCPLGKSDRWYP